MGVFGLWPVDEFASGLFGREFTLDPLLDVEPGLRTKFTRAPDGGDRPDPDCFAFLADKDEGVTTSDSANRSFSASKPYCFLNRLVLTPWLA